MHKMWTGFKIIKCNDSGPQVNIIRTPTQRPIQWATISSVVPKKNLLKSLISFHCLRLHQQQQMTIHFFPRHGITFCEHSGVFTHLAHLFWLSFMNNSLVSLTSTTIFSLLSLDFFLVGYVFACRITMIYMLFSVHFFPHCFVCVGWWMH